MPQSAIPHEWAQEQQRWASYYTDRLPFQLRQVTTFVTARRDKLDSLRPHFESCLALLEATADLPDLSALWVELVDALPVFGCQNRCVFRQRSGPRVLEHRVQGDTG